MKFARYVIQPLVLSFIAALTLNAATTTTVDQAKREEVRKQLSAFFAEAGTSSPAAFGGLQKSPETMQAVQQRIASMSDKELAEFQKLMAETPDWKNAPQALLKVVPPEMMKQVQAASADLTARVPKGEKMREDVSTILSVLKLLPETKLKELGIAPGQVDSLEQSLQQLTPLQTAVLQKQLSEKTGWDVQGAAAVAAMPPALQKGAVALAKHGPITALDIVELEKYRALVVDVLKRVNALPEESKKSFHVESIGVSLDQIGAARPDVLFMLREQLTPESLARLSENVAILEKAASLTPKEKEQLEHFRQDFADTFSRLQPENPDQGLQKTIAGLSSSDLMILQSKLPDYQQWQYLLPAYYQAVTAPGFAQRLAAVQQPQPDAATVASLEDFRAQALNYISAAARDASVTPELVASARKIVEEAKLPQLEMIRSVSGKMPETASAASRLQTVVNLAYFSLDCVFTIHTPDPLPNIDIDLNFICHPIRDAINTVIDGISTAINAVKNEVLSIVDTIKNGLQSAIDAVTNTVNTLVNGIISTVNTIWNFLQTIPDLAWSAIKAALNFLLDVNLGGFTLRNLIQDGISVVVPKLQQALGLGASFWTSMQNFTLPLLPCPPTGFHTPFGNVGDGFAVTNYNRYKFFLDKIIGMIPSTETSLAVKIPAQVLYAAFDYLGVCLADAAADAADALTENRFNTTQTNISNSTTLLGQQLAIAFTNLTNLQNTQGGNLTTLINTNSMTIQTLINNKFIDVTNLINTKTRDAKDLELRLQIELNLQASESDALAAFQTPMANGGYLELARDIVSAAIAATLATGQSAGMAQKWLADAQANLANGKFKDAYRSLQKSYKELTR